MFKYLLLAGEKLLTDGKNPLLAGENLLRGSEDLITFGRADKVYIVGVMRKGFFGDTTYGYIELEFDKPEGTGIQLPILQVISSHQLPESFAFKHGAIYRWIYDLLVEKCCYISTDVNDYYDGGTYRFIKIYEGSPLILRVDDALFVVFIRQYGNINQLMFHGCTVDPVSNDITLV